MKCLVTGGAGFIGSHLVDKLIKDGHKVVVIDNLSTGGRKNLNSKADSYKIDIRDFKKIKSLFKDMDFVFHLAAMPRVIISVERPIETSEVNIIGTINVFKAAAEANVKRVIFSSSSSVYGNQKTLPMKENMVPNPLSPYALQKLIGEQIAKLFTSLYKTPIISLRYFNVYGPRTDFDSDYGLVIGKFLRLKSQKKPMTIFGDGKQIRGFCYVDDVVMANIRAMKAKGLRGGEVINIGSERSDSINYLANLIGGKIKYLPTRKGDVLNTKADITLAKKLIMWQPKISLKEGLKKVEDWFNKL
jgi:UDP-glucose 4-epimerase